MKELRTYLSLTERTEIAEKTICFSLSCIGETAAMHDMRSLPIQVFSKHRAGKKGYLRELCGLERPEEVGERREEFELIFEKPLDA
jgi:hypothetical protein